MGCSCIEEMDAKLSPHNMRLVVTFGFRRDGGSYLRPKIQTEKINSRKKETALAYPSFCPFCGAAYQQAMDQADLARQDRLLTGSSFQREDGSRVDPNDVFLEGKS
jgi:hypothetical protein